ncbi:hypothetical protein SUGI_1064070 [Cryptomeria japonica]|nr:hypothetical protein SUGI_1064020 [Cryptomeria japonica]GLJ50025.1 hypothetical protein SUGI_1064070 [Cryptomeria japonica]
MEGSLSKWHRLNDSSLFNRKLIRACYFNKEFRAISEKLSLDGPIPMKDSIGHGSHKSSTEGGKCMEGVDFYAYALVETCGVAPLMEVVISSSSEVCVFNVKSSSENTVGFDVPRHEAKIVISRGPYPPSQNILKPNVTAPLVANILAAWLPNTTNGDSYAIESGSSISSPHVVRLVFLMKAVHSEWSPAIIKSALRTTSYTVDNSHNAIIAVGFNGSAPTPFDMGVGHVDPNKAVDPGIVYEIGVEDYVNYLCTINYTTQQIQSITGTPA